jgi:peptide/nickel transport system substrate-binding protein
MTADDVIFTVNAICSAGDPGRDRAGFDHIVSQERRSATEVVWHFGPRPRGSCGLGADLASGLYPALDLLGPSLWVLPAHRLAGLADTGWRSDPYFQRPDVVSGPFLVKSEVAGSLIELGANPEFAAGRPRGAYLAGVTYRYFLGKAAEIAGLQTAEADLGFHLQPDDVAQVAAIPRSSSEVGTTLQGEFLVPNHGPNTATGLPTPWFGDEPVLAALALAIDRRALNTAAFGGAAGITPGLFPAALAGLTVEGGPAAGALAEAQQVLEGDGWRAGSDGIRSKAGRRLEFTLLTVCDSAPRQVEQAELVRQWGLAGAVVRAACEPRSSFFGGYAEGGVVARGGFDISLYSNTWRPDPDDWARFAAATSIPTDVNPGGLNWGRCADVRLDQDFAAGAATLDAGRRRAAYLDAAGEWLRYGCTIPLFDWPAVVQRTARLHGFVTDSTLGLDTGNAEDWWLSAP